ncbi:MAG: DeoR family transcriptional regulator [Patescibacteria group bacterium]
MSFNNFIDLYKRTERLSSAVFLVSNTIFDSDELKTKIKYLAINLISCCLAIKDNITAEKIGLVSEMESVLMEIASLLDIASVSGLVSSMNASILKQEFDLLAKNLNKLREYCNDKSDISKGFFAESDYKIPNRFFPMEEDKKLIREAYGIEKNKSNKKVFREKTIIEIIKTKGKVNIKDISKLIKGCSEKTIQRKLISLVKNGILKKEGERRWSRYSLINIG